MGYYAANGFGYGANPKGKTTIDLTDTLSNYRYILAVSGYYVGLSTVIGSILIPTKAFFENSEYMFYATRGSDSNICWDAICKANANDYIKISLTCNSTCPMTIFGIK